MSDETPLTPETEEKETAGAENNTQEAEIPTWPAFFTGAMSRA